MKRFFLLVAALVMFLPEQEAAAQDAWVAPSLMNGKWPAQWISCPGIAQRAYGVYHFRKKIHLASKPSSFIVHVTADNRYRLFVNGKAVSMGPARGDLYNWYFESVNIAPYLQQGDNQLAALVWNMGEWAPVAQVSNQTGFLLQGNDQVSQIANTNESWLVIQDSAYQPCSLETASVLKTYFVAGPGDYCKASRYPWNWEQLYYDDSHWQKARRLSTSATPVGYGTDNYWSLAKRTIPAMEDSLLRLASIRRTAGISIRDTGFLRGKSALVVPAFSNVSILVDQSFLTLAYPEFSVSNGKGSVVKITYAEALYKNGVKGNRNDVQGKEILGLYDIFEPDGQKKCVFRPLWQRCYRYIQLDITTQEQPLVLEDIRGYYSGYPFVRKASFNSSDPSLQQIWDVGWRTARLCAGETYYDCPYYEQLQYVADTRIQALISLYLTGDNRLMKKAIREFFYSRVPEGLTQGRYPSNRLQVIPPFSLYWISMVYDLMMYCQEDGLVQEYLTAIQGVLDWYEKHIDQYTGMLGPMKWWNFTDWSAAFPDMGVPPGATDGGSSILTLHYAYTLQQAAVMFTHFKKYKEAAHCKALAEKLNKATVVRCFDDGRNLFADKPLKTSYSQHAGIMAILSGAVDNQKAGVLMDNIISDTSIAQATFYYRFYLAEALKKTGKAEKYYSQLTPWRNMIANGLTTFAENPDPARSDCHAWSASPSYDFLATLCGISSLAPGFQKVQIKPQMGELSFVNGTMPTHRGDLVVSVTRKGNTGVSARVNMPVGMEGVFVWQQKQYALKEGNNLINID